MVSELLVLFFLLLLDHFWFFAEHIVFLEWFNGIEEILIVYSFTIRGHCWYDGLFNQIG